MIRERLREDKCEWCKSYWHLRRFRFGENYNCKKISEIIPDFLFIAQDNYYKSAEYMNNKNITAFNFDHPDAFDNDLIIEHLKALKEFKSIDMPQYDFVHHRRKDEYIHLEPKKLVIFEGIMVFLTKG